MRTVLTLLCVFLSVVVLPAQRGQRAKPSEATQACGSEIPWETSVEAALVKAKESGRPVFWYIPTVAQSPMDRKDIIDHYMMAGPFSSPVFATLISRRTIPVKAIAKGDLQRRYGLKVFDFIEPGFVILSPEGEVKGKLDKITTFHAPWLVWQLRRLLVSAGSSEDSDVVKAARTAGDLEKLAQELLAEGDIESAARIVPTLKPTAASGLMAGQIHLARGEGSLARTALNEALASAKGTALLAAAHLQLGIVELADGKYADAVTAFRAALKSKPSATPDVAGEARFLLGVSLHRQGKTSECRAEWKTLAASPKASRWSRKASAELERFGPMARAFEVYEWLPEGAYLEAPDGTCVPRTDQDIPLLTRRSVELLLRTQLEDGSWRDSNYDFGGQDSLPNVYVACSALCAQALLEWRDVDPEGVNAALARALPYLLDESNLALDDKDELIWAYVYRLWFFERLLSLGGPEQGRVRRKVKEIAGILTEQQQGSGAWRHEYPNPFVTASVIHALDRGQQAGAPLPKDAIAKGAELLLKARGADGTFSYGMPRRKGGGAVEGAAGRMPLCELGLFLGGESDQEKLTAAIVTSFEHHHRLEAARKYDNHADRYANGGFFFWYDQIMRTEAIGRITDRDRQSAFLEQQRKIVLAIPEIDGTFVDSHELGKTYGTAMGLMTLKRVLPEAQ